MGESYIEMHTGTVIEDLKFVVAAIGRSSNSLFVIASDNPLVCNFYERDDVKYVAAGDTLRVTGTIRSIDTNFLTLDCKLIELTKSRPTE